MTSELHLSDPGLWAELRTKRRGGPALFLDRDGVVVEEVNYLHRIADVRLTDGAANLIAQTNTFGLLVVMVTNQAGVGRGYYGWADFHAVQDEIHRRLAKEGAHVDAVYACGYHEKGRPPLNTDHAWRKPNPGMLARAAAELGIDLRRSWIVGDRASDLAAGFAAGLTGGSLVSTGYGSNETEIAATRALASASFRVNQITRLGSFDPSWLF